SLFEDSVLTTNNSFYSQSNHFNLSKEQIDNHAHRIEKEYNFTFKQSLFPDLIQVSKSQNGRKIVLPEKEFNKLDH
ncbi:MAG: hypothetical protein PF487_01555, partial [Bacteroidales bacterium]|nr:hypothetical protein [Bacteroidales bacterium]